MAKTVVYTSLNQVAAGLKKAVKHEIVKSGMKVIDFGGGRFKKGINFLEEHGIESRVIDPYALTEDENSENIEWIYKHNLANVVFLNNVLNVIPYRSERKNCILNAWSLLRLGGTLVVTIYEGNKGGSVTGFQNNWVSSCYLGEILETLAGSVVFKKLDGMYLFQKV